MNANASTGPKDATSPLSQSSPTSPPHPANDHQTLQSGSGLDEYAGMEEHSGDSGLQGFERSDAEARRPPFVLTRAEVKLLGIAGVGFFLDAYDLFIINPVSTMLQYRLYGGAPLPSGLAGLLKAAANIGSVIGQFLFGYLADALGRRAIYGKELLLIIFATILCLTTPTGSLSPTSSLIYLSIFRILLGVGVGADYPMSASVSSERVSTRKRGVMLAYVFSAQGWGSLVGALVVIIVLLCYSGEKNNDIAGGEDVGWVDGVWRICVGLSLVPAVGTLYQRLTLPEARRWREARGDDVAGDGTDGAEKGDVVGDGEKEKKALGGGKGGKRIDGDGADDDVEAQRNRPSSTSTSTSQELEQDHDAGVDGDLDSDGTHARLRGQRGVGEGEVGGGKGGKVSVRRKGAHFREFLTYFSEWRHAKILIGTSVCWFLLDVAFYGINLNQNVVLQQIGFDGSSGTPWTRLLKIGVGNVIVTALGFVPGYYVSVLTIEYLGRKFIQIQGFLMTALFLGILAGKFHTLSTAAFVVNFAFLQFFFNFGANTTTYCYPAEVFPTRFRASAHGLSAASGKAGAIISALAFNSLSESVGTPVVLWIFFGCSLAGACFTLLLPEVKGRDPDVVDREEMRAAAAARKGVV
ncbi:MFS general substrate transporter [Schizopora paradoxa]|uniref:MFS general substrate transporter n=1 Tax=Schizopora paradoxa TaxID=27342 RepID=A0A0H2R0X7_9AGAM|nr:MFS general substrate transporter [Schizopora paradoxa]